MIAKLSLLLIFFSYTARAEFVYESEIKNLEGDAWFEMHLTQQESGDTRHSQIDFLLGRQHELAAHEEFSTTAVGRFISYSTEQKQLHEKIEITLEGRELKFKEKKTPDGEEKQKTIHLTENEADNCIVPPMLFNFLASDWKKAESGSEWPLFLIAPSMHDTFRFFYQLKSKDAQHETYVLKAKSIFVALKVDPIDFVYTKDHKLEAVRNFVPPIRYKTKDGGLAEKVTSIHLVR